MKPKTYQLITREVTQKHEVAAVIHSTTDADTHARIVAKLREAKTGEPHDVKSSYGNSRPIRITAIAVNGKFTWLTEGQPAACKPGKTFPSAVAAAEAVGVTPESFRAIMHQTRKRKGEQLNPTFIIRGVAFEQCDPQTRE